MKNIFIILFFSFIYADCYEIDNQVTCESSEHCVWDGEDGLCEDDHDHDHEDCVQQGDITGDGGLNVLDIVALVDCILFGTCHSLDTACAADLNDDGGYNIMDVIALVDCVLDANCNGTGRIDDASISKLIIGNDVVSIKADGYIGGVQMTITHNNDFIINMAQDAYIAEYITNGGETTLLILKPLDELFNYKGEFDIKETIVANSYQEVPVNVIPSSFKLSNAYPNPFNPSTSMTLKIPFATNVNINVYNIAGQVVSNLLNGYMDADSYDITWNAVEMPSGVYFIKARLDGITETQKVMLIK